MMRIRLALGMAGLGLLAQGEHSSPVKLNTSLLGGSVQDFLLTPGAILGWEQKVFNSSTNSDRCCSM